MGVRTRRYDIASYLRISAADVAARDEARRVIETWNQELAAGRDVWWSPTIRSTGAPPGMQGGPDPWGDLGAGGPGPCSWKSSQPLPRVREGRT